MKKFRFITALVLVLGLVLSLPFAAQAEETEFREVYLDAAYKVSDTQVLFDFSEPIKINNKSPWIDVRMTNKQGAIIGVYDESGNRTGYYQWTASVQYLNSEHDKLLLTMTGSNFGCDTFSELMAGKGTFPDDVKEKIQNGTYRFLAGLEETYLVNKNEYMNDGMLKNLCAEDDETVYVWPTRLQAGECVHAFLDELLPLPASIKIDPNQFEPTGGKGQNWDFDIMELGEPLEIEGDGSEDVITTTVVKNDPVVIAIILGAGVVVAAVLIVVFVLASKKRKAA